MKGSEVDVPAPVFPEAGLLLRFYPSRGHVFFQSLDLYFTESMLWSAKKGHTGEFRHPR